MIILFIKKLLLNRYTLIGIIILGMVVGSYYKGRIDERHKHLKVTIKEVIQETEDIKEYVSETDRIHHRYRSMPTNTITDIERLLSGQASEHSRPCISSDDVCKTK